MVIGRYAVYDRIASGGMATVHFGRLLGSAGFARTVAIKRLHRQYAQDPEFVAMFLDEARLAARIRHPNVVQTLDVAAVADELFVVMEYVHGATLSHLMRPARSGGAAIPVDIASSIIVQALRGLHAAHEALSEHGDPLGIVHRDVSPQNILVGSDGMARILDFGVAKASWRAQTTKDGQLKGKLSYMAPEQARDGAIGPWTDSYSTAVVFWEALTGRRLFQPEDGAAVLARFLDKSAAPLASVYNPAVPANLDEILARALELDFERRFSTAQEMADAIEAVVPQASPSNVARWLRSVAREDLEQHLRIVAAIERDSSNSERSGERTGAGSVGRMLAAFRKSPLPPATDDSASADERPGSEELTQGAQISMTSPPSLGESGPPVLSWRGWAMLGGGVAALILLLLANAARGRVGASTPDIAAAMPLAPPLTKPAPTPSAVVVAVGDLPPEADSPRAPASPPPAPPPPTALGKKPRTAVGSPASSGTGAQTQRSAACSPPYIVDSRGIRHMKLACLR
jgi:serine/threonine protein kinase